MSQTHNQLFRGTYQPTNRLKQNATDFRFPFFKKKKWFLHLLQRPQNSFHLTSTSNILWPEFYKLLSYLIVDWELVFQSNKTLNKISVFKFKQLFLLNFIVFKIGVNCRKLYLCFLAKICLRSFFLKIKQVQFLDCRVTIIQDSKLFEYIHFLKNCKIQIYQVIVLQKSFQNFPILLVF